MARINLSGGQWFDRSKAQAFEEDTFFDGRNMISKATGTQFEHEKLYRTASGNWVLRAWSQWQGSRDKYRLIEGDRAKAWLLSQEHYREAEEYFPNSLSENEV